MPGSIVNNPSLPMPKCREQAARANLTQSRSSERSMLSTRTKSLPDPETFINWMCWCMWQLVPRGYQLSQRVSSSEKQNASVIRKRCCGDGGSRTRVRREDHQDSSIHSQSFDPRSLETDRQDPEGVTSTFHAFTWFAGYRQGKHPAILSLSAPFWNSTGGIPQDGLLNV